MYNFLQKILLYKINIFPNSVVGFFFFFMLHTVGIVGYWFSHIPLLLDGHYP